MKSGSPWGRRRRGFVRRHPYFVLALVLHLAVFGGLYKIGDVTLRRASEARESARIEASAQQARRLQMQRSVARLEDMQRRLDAATGAGSQAPAASGADAADAAASAAKPDPAVLLKRAQALAARIEHSEQAQRAHELARLLKIAPEQALAKVAAEDQAQRAKEPPLPADPASAAAQLEQRARQALDRQARRQAHDDQGSRLTLAQGGANQGSGGSGAGQGKGSKQSGQGGHGQGQGSGSGGVGHGTGQGDGAGATDAALAGGALRTEAGFSDPRNYAVAADLPQVDPARVHPGRGRTLGRGGEFADRVYLDQWYVVGPFDAQGPVPLQSASPPEWGVDLDAVYRGKGGSLLQWVLADGASYPFIPPDRAENAVYYAWTEVRVDHDTTVWIDIGADDDSKLWVNDALVWVSGDADKAWYHRPFYQLEPQVAAYDLVEGRRRVTLHAGRNTLLFKLYNGIDLTFLSVVVAK